MDTDTNLINGKRLSGSGELLRSLNPSTGELNWEAHAAETKEVDSAVDAAREAFEQWSDYAPERRIEYVKSFKDLLLSNSEEFSETICKDTGKPRWEAKAEVDAMVEKTEIAAEAFFERTGATENESRGATTATRFKPHGVIAVFGPFNLPGHLPNAHIVPALTAGNTVVFKPSEKAPLTADFLSKLWHSTGLPPGVLNMVQGARRTGKLLAENDGIDGLFFTGSAKVGRAVHAAFAGRPEKMVALEMGGNNPLVVHGVSDKAAAAYLTVLSAYITAGQRCTCARRLVVPKGSEGDSFIDALIRAIHSIRTGAYFENPEPFMGPVIDEATIDNLLAADRRLLRAGGGSIITMSRLDRSGYFLTPGLMDVTAIAERPDEEFFGPFLQLVRAENFDRAMKEARSTAFGLAAGLISDDEDLYRQFFRKSRAGLVNWNRQTTGASGRLPFGGVGISGNHRPSGYFAADYCSYAVASIENKIPILPENTLPGIG